MTAEMATPPESRRYSRLRYQLALVHLLGSLAFLLAYHLSGAGFAAARWAAQLTISPSLQLAICLFALSGAMTLMFLPMDFFRDYIVEHSFGLSRQTVGGWVKRKLKQTLIDGAFSLAIIEGLYAIMRRLPSAWPIPAAAGWVLVSIVLARIFPVVILPIFYKTAPLQEHALAQRLLALCERARLPALGVFRLDLGAETRKANAALAGFGGTRRVLLSDTLLERFTPEEIETVLGHELGHQRFRHIGKMLILSGLGSWLMLTLLAWAGGRWAPSLGLTSLADPAGLPLLLLAMSVLGVLGLPLQHALSRHFEWQSDRFAVEITQQAGVFASALRKLGELNLADPQPPAWAVWLFYDHPPLPDRVRAAEAAAV